MNGIWLYDQHSPIQQLLGEEGDRKGKRYQEKFVGKKVSWIASEEKKAEDIGNSHR